MAIRLEPWESDDQGLPVVSWEEDRNLFAPDGIGPARVACFIRPDAKTGVLHFVAAGSVRQGAFEEARPWEFLHSFERGTAEQHYYPPSGRALINTLAGKSKSGLGRLLATDGAQVLLANFADERRSVPMHLNCAEASPGEIALLHDRLRREFIDRRGDIVHEICCGEFVWQPGKAFKPFAPPEPAAVPRWAEWLVNASIAALLTLLGFGFYALVMR